MTLTQQVIGLVGIVLVLLVIVCARGWRRTARDLQATRAADARARRLQAEWTHPRRGIEIGLGVPSVVRQPVTGPRAIRRGGQ
jgi:hypothetical protein